MTAPITRAMTSGGSLLPALIPGRTRKVTGPTDHGFAQGISFRDPDENLISVLEYGPEHW